MKISVCVPQYNRIQYLLKSLRMIEQQRYHDIEVVISDDCSSDNTEEEIRKLIPHYKYPIVYYRNKVNQGYDFNYRQCITLASGVYALVIGNDDSLFEPDSIDFLVSFLQENDYPEIGFCNCVEERLNNKLMKRAHTDGVLGIGVDVALKYYSTFSFVGGLIYKTSTFRKFNTDKHDGSIYAQMYLGTFMIASGCRLFSIAKPLVVKDILINNVFRNSYRDRIAKRWKDYRKVDGGLPSVINVLTESFNDAGVLNKKIAYRIFKRIYTVTFPFWIQDYKSNGALPEAVGLIQGLNPFSNKQFRLLTTSSKTKIFGFYAASSATSLLLPNFLFKKVQTWLYQRMKR